MKTNGAYSPPSARQMSVWLANDDIDYVTKVAGEEGVSRNRAFAIMIQEHREQRARRAERKAARQK